MARDLAAAAAHRPFTSAVFIDANVPDLQTLIDGAKPGEKVFVIDPSSDGLSQISADLSAAHLTNLTSIAIVAHGSSGALQLGSSTVDDADLSAHQAALAAIGTALNPSGKLELYCCDVAAGAAGKTFIADFSHAAGGVDVAASTQQIGQTATGENWTLDSATGAPVSATSSPFTRATIQSYQGTLAAQPSGQLWFYNSATSGSGSVGYSNTTVPSQFTAVAEDANGDALQQRPQSLGLDTANGLFFVLADDGENSGADVNNGRIYVGSIKTGQILSSQQIGNNQDEDAYGPMVVDPANHTVYVDIFGGGNAPTRAENEILAISYDPATGALDMPAYNPDTQSQSTTANTVVSNQSDSRFVQGSLALDQTTQTIYYSTNATQTYQAPGSSYTYPLANSIYSIGANARVGDGGPGAQLITSLPTYGSTDSSGNSDYLGQIGSLAIDDKDGLIFFTTEPAGSSAPSGIYYVPISGGTAKQLATGSTTFTFGSSDGSLSFDPTTNQLYIASQPVLGGDHGEIYRGTISYSNGTATISGGLSVFYTTSSTSNVDDPLTFDALPMLTVAGTTASAVPSGSPLTLAASTPTITDPDSGGFLDSATVQITKGGTAVAGDVLSVSGATLTGTSGTTKTYTLAYDSKTFTITYDGSTSDATPNTLTITSPKDPTNGVTATDADYQHILSLVQYQDGSTDAAARTITWQVNDGAAGSPSGTNTATTSVTIAKPPTIVSGGVALKDQAATTIMGNALTGDSDPNNGTLTVTAVEAVGSNGNTAGTVGTALTGTYGSLKLNSDGSYTYTADTTAMLTGVTGHPADKYSFTVTSSSGTSANETFAVMLNRPPTVTADTATAKVGGASPMGNVLANASDPDGDTPISVSAVSFGSNAATAPGTTNGAYGSLKLGTSGAYTYTLNIPANAPTGQQLSDVFNYTASDGQGGTASSTLTVDIVRNPVVATGGYATTAVDGTPAIGAGGAALTGDSDPDSSATNTLSVTAVGGVAASVGTAVQGTYGSLMLNRDGSYTYTAGNNSTSQSGIAGVQNAHPVDSFTYTVGNSDGGSTTETFKVNVDRAPTVTASTATADQGGASPTGNVLTNASDPDGDNVTVSAVSAAGNAGTLGGTTAGTYGALTLNADGSYSYALGSLSGAPTGSPLTDVFSYTASDGHGGTTPSTLTVDIVRNPTVATGGYATSVLAGASASGTPGTALTGDSDPDGGTLSISAVNGTAGNVGTAVTGTYGALTLQSTGAYSYAASNATVIAGAATGSHPVDSFTYTVTNGEGASTAETFKATIDRAPTVTADTATADQGASTPTTGNVLTNDSDADGDALSVSAVSSAGGAGTVGATTTGTYGTLTLNANGTYSYALGSLTGAPTGKLTDVFNYTASDGQGGSTASTLTVDIVRNPTVAAGGYATSVPAGATASGTPGTALTGDSDPDGGTLSVSAVQGAAGNVSTAVTGTYGALTLQSTGAYSYAASNSTAIAGAATGSHPVDSFSYTVTNSEGASTAETFKATIDRAPTVTADTATADQGASAPTTGNVLTNDSDADGDALSVSAVSSANGAGTVGATTTGTYGTLTLNANGSYSYALGSLSGAPTGSPLTDVFSYTASDGHGGTTPSTLTVDIVRNPVVATNGYATTALAGTTASGAAGSALTGDSDPDGGALSVSAVNGVAGNVGTAVSGTYGALTLQSTGAYSYAASNTTAIAGAATGSHPVDSFTYAVADSDGGATTESFKTTINRAPTGTGVTTNAPEGTTTTGAAGAALANDTDADSDTLSVASVSYTDPTTHTTTAGMLGQSIAGQYGELTLNGDGSYSYVADNAANYALASAAGQAPVDDFTYTVSDGHGGTTGPQTLELDVIACFATGTRIRVVREQTERDVAVEALAVGDLVVTAAGARRPIKWLGHRTIDCRRHPRPHEAHPIRIAAHALGEGKPARDLFVSPGHAICVDVLGEVLIPAVALVNGATFCQIEVDTMTYWHVELDSHDVILADNLATESYLDMGNRGFFAEADAVDLAASPDADPARRTHADFCRPFHGEGPLVEVVRAQIRKGAEAAGWTLTSDLALHLEVDGRRLDPVVRGLTARFQLPPEATDVWLVSPTARPSDTIGTGDGRDLGLCLGALRIDDGFAPRIIAIDDPLLCIGFHHVEDGVRRWTAGRARLPAALWAGWEDGFFLRIELAGAPVPRWIAPPAARKNDGRIDVSVA